MPPLSNTSTSSSAVLVHAQPAPRQALDASVRLRVVAAVFACVWAFGLIKVATAGRWAEQLAATFGIPDVGRLVTAGHILGTLGILVSIVVILIAAREQLSSSGLVNLGLGFGVFGTLVFAFAEAQLPVRPEQLRPFFWTSLWVLFFPMVVPSPPSKAAGALLLAVLMVPLAIGLAVVSGVPAPAAAVAGLVVGPTIVAALMAMGPVVALHRMDTRLRETERAARRLGSYRLEEKLGEGGMGEVWRASHAMLRRPAALKLVRVDRAGDDRIARFEREAMATADLHDPHTVQLFDFGVAEDGRLYYAMELLDGIDLGTLVTEFGPQPPARVVHLLAQAAESLAEAHARGLVHRDIKPSNMVASRYSLHFDFVKVLDFGLVTGGVHLDDEHGLTRTGVVSGTPAYMAPEVAKGEPVDGRADLYSLGCVAYWLLTGRLVFDRDNPVTMILAHCNDPVPPLGSEFDVPPALHDLVMQLLEKSPADRPGSATEVRDRLRAIDADPPWDEHRARQWWDAHRPASQLEFQAIELQEMV